MTKLVCDIGACNSKKENLKTLVTQYNELLRFIISLENSRGNLWKSDAEKVYCEKFIERKHDLENLSLVYSELLAFLDKAFNSYENIESKYS